MQQYVSLKYGHEPLQVQVPDSFEGDRSSIDDEIYLETVPKLLTNDEIVLCEAMIKTLPYKQSLIRGAVFYGDNDPLLECDHDQLDAIEVQNSLTASRSVSNGGTRSLYERVLIIREQGYIASGKLELVGAV